MPKVVKEKFAPTAYEQQFLLEYFKEMRSEINVRIKNHTNLVWAKVVTTGALMSFLVTQQIDARVRVCGFVFIPVISILYDVMVAQNLRAIHKVGHFIRDNIEDKLFPDLVLWEKYGGQKNAKERNYGPVDIFLLSLFTFGTMASAVFLMWNDGQAELAVIATIIFLVSFILLVRFMVKYIMFFQE